VRSNFHSRVPFDVYICPSDNLLWLYCGARGSFFFCVRAYPRIKSKSNKPICWKDSIVRMENFAALSQYHQNFITATCFFSLTYLSHRRALYKVNIQWVFMILCKGKSIMHKLEIQTLETWRGLLFTLCQIDICFLCLWMVNWLAKLFVNGELDQINAQCLYLLTFCW
jgi:hypothetical protein